MGLSYLSTSGSGRWVINMMVLLRSLSHCVAQGGMDGHSNPHPLSNCYQKESRQKVNWPSVARVQTRGTITIIIIKWNNIMWVVLLLLLSASLGFGNKILNFVRCCFCMGLNDMAWDCSGLEHVLTMCGCCYGYAIIICRTFKNISYSAHSHTPGKSQTHPSIHPIQNQSPVQSKWWPRRRDQMVVVNPRRAGKVIANNNVLSGEAKRSKWLCNTHCANQ